MEPSDEHLAREYVASGELRLLDMLVGRHIASIRNLIFPMVLNNADADDLTQETFVKAAAALPKFQHRCAFKTWLFRIAVNTTRDFMRRRGNLLLELRPEMPEMTCPGPTPPATAMSNEETQRLMAVIARLSPCLRRAFVLVGINEFAPREAAAMEGCLTATMYRRVHVARRQLQKWLQEGKK